MGMPLAHRRFTVAEYHRMAEVGILGEHDRVELLDGEIVQVSPIGTRHAAIVTRVAHLLHRIMADRASVRVQNPVRLDDYSEPEPDIALVTPRDDFYAAAHPAPRDILLIVEVLESSARYDRQRKVPGYARAGIADVWLVDLSSDRVETYRAPRAGGYTHTQIVTPNDVLAPVLLPDIAIRVNDLLG